MEAAEASGADGAAAGAGASVAWQGTQLRLCAAALDSLKRELARERATASSAREEARRSDSVAEQAPRMMLAHCTCCVRALCTPHRTRNRTPHAARDTPHAIRRTPHAAPHLTAPHAARRAARRGWRGRR